MLLWNTSKNKICSLYLQSFTSESARWPYWFYIELSPPHFTTKLRPWSWMKYIGNEQILKQNLRHHWKHAILSDTCFRFSGRFLATIVTAVISPLHENCLHRLLVPAALWWKELKEKAFERGWKCGIGSAFLLPSLFASTRDVFVFCHQFVLFILCFWSFLTSLILFLYTVQCTKWKLQFFPCHVRDSSCSFRYLVYWEVVCVH